MTNEFLIGNPSTGMAVKRLIKENQELKAESERLRAALKECEAELDAYYRAEYPTDHPYHKRKLENALAANPARVALEQNK